MKVLLPLAFFVYNLFILSNIVVLTAVLIDPNNILKDRLFIIMSLTQILLLLINFKIFLKKDQYE